MAYLSRYKEREKKIIYLRERTTVILAKSAESARMGTVSPKYILKECITVYFVYLTVF
jgi:hypothetical protein